VTGRPHRILALALANTVLAGCGVTAETTPRPITPPRGFLQTTTPPTPEPTGNGPVTEQLFLVKDSALIPVTRHVDHQPTTDDLLADLLAGPDDSEQAEGLSSALQGGDVVSNIHVSDRRAVVELSTTIENAARNDEVLAYAQLVCTLTARADITGVTFTHNGQPIGVPRADGSLTQGPLTAADYTTLLATAPPTTHS